MNAPRPNPNDWSRNRNHPPRDPINNWNASRKLNDRPGHLPPKPPMPLGTGGSRPVPRDGEGDGGLNYG
jgi:hypothetical protein